MRKEERLAKKKYDFAAESYHHLRTKKYPSGWLYNEMLEMPAVLELLGNISGKKILDFGCGTGIYAKLLTKKGALVKGFDISPEMIKIAKKENPKLDLKVGLGYNIPFNEKFDIVIASLVVHYLEDWDKMLSEIRRVLKNDGILIFSTGNPVSECAEKRRIAGKKIRVFGDYFTERKIYANWHNINNKTVKMFLYHKTYETIIKTLIKNGFEIIDYKDCYPLKKAKKLFPKDFAFTSKVPYFCAWKVRRT